VTERAPERLALHLRSLLGAWPPASGAVEIVGSERRTPEHGGRWWMPVFAVRAPDGAVLSLPPTAAERLASAGTRVDLDSAELWHHLAELAGEPGARHGRGVFRWTERPTGGRQTGEWTDPADPRIPEWLRPFDGEVLAVFDDDGAYLAGAGRKQHDAHGHEISVGVEPAARGRGLARGLTTRMAWRILADGAIPTYIHDPQNVPSCRVADAAGFPDRGWSAMALWRAGGGR
jgi:GNAT superfamily N-acetyltransferase